MTRPDSNPSTRLLGHVVSTASDFLDGGWHGECSCGWRGPDHVAHDEALEDAQIHAKEQSA